MTRRNLSFARYALIIAGVTALLSGCSSRTSTSPQLTLAQPTGAPTTLGAADSLGQQVFVQDVRQARLLQKATTAIAAAERGSKAVPTPTPNVGPQPGNALAGRDTTPTQELGVAPEP